MSLTKEDLQAIQALMEAEREHTSQMMDSKLQPIRADIAKLNHDTVPKINHMYDCLGGVQDKFNKLDVVEAKQQDHDHRIWALEQKAKAV